MYQMSVILITPDHYGTIRNAVRNLQCQTVTSVLEIVIVCPSRASLELIESELDNFAGYQVVEIGNFSSTAVARAAGVQHAYATIVAFTEDHSFPAPRWAELLITRHQEAWTGVGPVFRNANPTTAVSGANFLIEYGDFADPIATRFLRHIPGHNSSYKRTALLEYGERLAEMLEAESPMQWDMMSRGHTFCMEPDAKAYHLNYSILTASLVVHFWAGRVFAASRCQQWATSRRLLYFFASPLIPIVRLIRISRTIFRLRQSSRLPMLFLFVIVMLIVSGAGEACGYLLHTGESMRMVSKREFHRERYLVPRDQKMLDNMKEFLSKIRD